jgi:hypothetical protein
MTERRLSIAIIAGIFVLLLVLVLEAAGIRHSLRRIEREERSLGPLRPFADSTADSLWQNATDGAWILVSLGPCSACRRPFYHRFLTKEGCEAALTEWNAALNEQRLRQAKGRPITAVEIGVLGNCEERRLRP